MEGFSSVVVPKERDTTSNAQHTHTTQRFSHTTDLHRHYLTPAPTAIQSRQRRKRETHKHSEQQERGRLERSSSRPPWRSREQGATMLSSRSPS